MDFEPEQDIYFLFMNRYFFFFFKIWKMAPIWANSVRNELSQLI